MSRSSELKHDFNDILLKLKQALDLEKTEVNRDAAILRFELAYEVSWKLIQHVAREEGVEVKSPRQAYRQAFALGWITDEVIWDDIIKARNKAVHVYREIYAQELYNQLYGFYNAFKELQDSLQ